MEGMSANIMDGERKKCIDWPLNAANKTALLNKQLLFNYFFSDSFEFDPAIETNYYAIVCAYGLHCRLLWLNSSRYGAREWMGPIFISSFSLDSWKAIIALSNCQLTIGKQALVIETGAAQQSAATMALSFGLFWAHSAIKCIILISLRHSNFPKTGHFLIYIAEEAP